jgi:hypothetical protein
MLTQVVGAKLAHDAGALFKAAGHPLQRRHQPLFEDRRAQVLHDALAGLDGAGHRLQRRQRPLLDLGCGGMPADPVELELQRRERAPDIVMDLACDGSPLGLDAGLQVLRQL